MKTAASVGSEDTNKVMEVGLALDQLVNQFAFQLFRDQQFRQLTKFDSLTQTEQDRIFNELIVSYLVLVMFVLESNDLKKLDDEKEFFLEVKEKMPEAHVQVLADLGIPIEFQKQWLQLIDMRYTEYVKDKNTIREEAIAVHAQEKELSVDDHLDIQLLLPVHTVAIGLHHHILRGKIKGEDELFMYLFKQISEKYVDIRMMIEQGEIKKWKKVWAKLLAKWKVLFGR